MILTDRRHTQACALERPNVQKDTQLVPVRRFIASHMVMRRGRCQLAGRVPVRSSRYTFRTRRLSGRVSTHAGEMVPPRYLFWSRFSSLKLVPTPRSVGMVPVRLQPPSRRTCTVQACGMTRVSLLGSSSACCPGRLYL